jgi:hypothetical protein
LDKPPGSCAERDLLETAGTGMATTIAASKASGKTAKNKYPEVTFSIVVSDRILPSGTAGYIIDKQPHLSIVRANYRP